MPGRGWRRASRGFGRRGGGTGFEGFDGLSEMDRGWEERPAGTDVLDCYWTRSPNGFSYIILITSGAKVMMNVSGKMNATSGKSISTGAC